MSKQQLDVASSGESLQTTTNEERTLIDGVIQERRASMFVSASDMPGENSPEAVGTLKVNTERVVGR